MLPLIVGLLSGLQAAEADRVPDLDIRVLLLDSSRQPLASGVRATLFLEGPDGSRALPMSLRLPKGFDGIDVVAPQQIRPVEGTSLRALLSTLPVPPGIEPAAARAGLRPGSYFRVRVRADEIPAGGAASILFEFGDDRVWARGFTLLPASAAPEPAGTGR